MKRFYVAVLFILVLSISALAQESPVVRAVVPALPVLQDIKITQLPTLGAATSDDLLLIVDAPGTVPATKKITVGAFFTHPTITSGLKLTPISDPGSPAAGDFWLNSSDLLRYRGASATFTVVNSTRSVNTSSPLSGGDTLAQDITLSCGSCEITSRKNTANGYAGLDSNSKLTASQGQEVWALVDLSDVTGKKGNATVVQMFGGGTPATDDCVKFDANGNVVSFGGPCGAALGYTAENAANKDASGGYVGLTLFKINFKNVADTFTSFFTNSNSAARTYTFQDRNGTIADDTDLALKAPLASPTFTGQVKGLIYDAGGQVYNLVEYGADPTGVSDSLAAFNAARNAAIAAGGGDIYVPAGSYQFSDELIIGDGTSTTISTYGNIRLIGEGGNRLNVTSFAGGTAVKFLWNGATSSAKTFLKINGPIGGIAVKGITFDCASKCGTVIKVMHAEHTPIEDDGLYGFTLIGLDVDDYNTASFNSGTRVTGEYGYKGRVLGAYISTASNSTIGIRVGATGTVSQWVFQNVAIRLDGTTGSAALELRHADANHFYSVVGAAAIGVRIKPIAGVGGFPGNNPMVGCTFTGSSSSNAYTVDQTDQTWTIAAPSGQPLYGLGTEGGAAAFPSDSRFWGWTDQREFFGGGLKFTGVPVAGGATNLTFTPGNHTGVTAETIDNDFAAHTITITGGFTNQRFTYFRKPTVTAASSLTITNSGTLVIEGAPVASGSAALTNRHALWVAADNSQFDGGVTTANLYGGAAAGSTLTIKGTSSGSPSGAHISLQPVSGATEIGGVLIGAPASSYLGTGDIIHVGVGDGNAPQITLDEYATAAPGPLIVGRHARGTFASPAATAANDVLFNLQGRGYQTTTNAFTSSVVNVAMIAAENFTSTAQGTYITFNTVPIGSTTKAERVRLTDVGNLKIAGTATRATTEGTNHLDIFDGTAPAGTLANGISLYSTSGELRVMDAAGNATLLSPHDRSDNSWIFDSVHTPSGRHLRIDVEKLLKAVNEYFGWDYVHIEGGKK